MPMILKVFSYFQSVNSVLLKLTHLAANNNKNYKKSTKFQKMKCWMCQNRTNLQNITH